MITQQHLDGLHIKTGATLGQIAADPTLLDFAGGLVPHALTAAGLSNAAGWTLAEALLEADSLVTKALLTTLLVLDAEIHAEANGARRVWPLPGFLSYRDHLPLADYPLSAVRLPPLNPDGHYVFLGFDRANYLAVRTDIHPRLGVAGHVRLASSSPVRPPQRLQVSEHRLERQVLDEAIIDAAVTAGSEALSVPLNAAERARLTEVLAKLAA
jgi:CO/xanthine dehydrogenase FAD-binding subunit